jgi:HlyD family type I secretion membrane fusion protein
MDNDPIIDLKANIIRPFRLAALSVAIFLTFVLIWANTAKLATTIHVSGTLVSSSPRYELQHPYGGKIETVLVEQHDELTKGQAVFELDVKLQKQSLNQVEKLISHIEEENKILERILQSNAPSAPTEYTSDTQTYYNEKLEQYATNIQNTQRSAQSLEKQIETRESSLDLLDKRRTITQDRLEHITLLASKGVATNAQSEDHSDKLMNLSSQLNDARGELTGLRDQLRQTRLKATQYQAELRLEFRKKQLANSQRLPELRRQSLGLKDEIENAFVRSPIAGSILELNFATNQMQIPKGATLAVISRPLEHPMVHVTIPTQTIDQVNTGMRGVLTMSSLPQRNLSRISAEIIAISPDIFTDPSGVPVGYKAVAKINHTELQTALDGLEINLHLASSMPAALALEGRKVTFSEYLVAPFFKIFQGAMQD